jgi:hypothetical protein
LAVVVVVVAVVVVVVVVGGMGLEAILPITREIYATRDFWSREQGNMKWPLRHRCTMTLHYRAPHVVRH